MKKTISSVFVSSVLVCLFTISLSHAYAQQAGLKWHTASAGYNKGYIGSADHLWLHVQNKVKSGELRAFGGCFPRGFDSVSNYEFIRLFTPPYEAISDDISVGTIIVSTNEPLFPDSVFVAAEENDPEQKPVWVGFIFPFRREVNDTCRNMVAFRYGELKQFLNLPMEKCLNNVLKKNYFNDVYVPASEIIVPAGEHAEKLISFFKRGMAKTFSGEIGVFKDPEMLNRYTAEEFRSLLTDYSTKVITRGTDESEVLIKDFLTNDPDSIAASVSLMPFVSLIKVWNRPVSDSYKHIGAVYAIAPVLKRDSDSLLRTPFYWYFAEFLHGFGYTDRSDSLGIIKIISALDIGHTDNYTVTKERTLKGNGKEYVPLNLPEAIPAGKIIRVTCNGPFPWSAQSSLNLSGEFHAPKEVYITGIDEPPPANAAGRMQIPVAINPSSLPSISSSSSSGILNLSYYIGGTVIIDENLEVINKFPPYVAGALFFEGRILCTEIVYSDPGSYQTNKVFYDNKYRRLRMKRYFAARDFKNSYAAVCKSPEEPLWGFIDSTGKEIAATVYQSVNEFSGGFAAVKKNGKWGWIDQSGAEVVAPVFDSAGFYSTEAKLINVRSGNIFGFADKNGKMKIEPQFQFAFPFIEELAAVKKNGRFGFINEKGKEIIACTYDSAAPFNGGIALVRNNGQYSYIDKKGVPVTAGKFDFATSFSDGRAYVYKKGIDGKLEGLGFIDKTGKLVSAVQSLAPEQNKIYRLFGFPLYKDGIYRIYRDDGLYISLDGRNYFLQGR